MNISDYKSKIDSFNNVLQQLIGKRASLQESLSQLLEKEESLEESLKRVENAKIMLELFVRSTEGSIRNYIEPIVTEALEFIFSQNLFFHIVFVSRRNQIEVDFIVLPKDKEKDYQQYVTNSEKYSKELEQLTKNYKDISFLYGGAIQEVLGLVLRLVLIELLQVKGPIVLDEPTSAVHEEYATRVGVFIKSLSKRFNRQIIYITHSHALANAANKVYEVKKINDVSKIEIANES